MSGTSIADHAITVGGAITANVVTELLKVLVPSITQDIKSLAWGFKDDLENLEKKLINIQAVMKDSENIQITETVKVWLEDLRDIAYDAEDVFDDFTYQVMRKEAIKGFKNKVRDYFSVSSNNPLHLRFEIAGKIKAINKRLEEILAIKKMFKFPNNCSINTAATVTANQGQSSADIRETMSFVELCDASNFVGRDRDRLEIVKLLTSSASQTEKLPVVPIVGMGGIGKTTLAQFVIKDELVLKFFELIIWIYVSRNFDVNRIIKEIIDHITDNKEKFDFSASRDRMVRVLHENLRGKKFLLVLDDLWNEDTHRWETLKTALTVGADGSKILVTTRNEQVVSTVHGTIDRYHLAQLTEDECWSIIMKKAFAAGGAKESPAMVETGKEIAKKCGGLPLVARTLGSLMYRKNRIGDWESIKANKVFDVPESDSKIISILKLSYDNLSSQSKRCFSYCCVFPKGYQIDKTTLINLWMAEGFLGNGNTMEYIGNECFNHLLQNSLIQDIEENLKWKIVRFKMHDLMHDLARKVLDSYECSVWKTCEPEYNPKVRRIQVALDDKEISAQFKKSLADAKRLRTVTAYRQNMSFVKEADRSGNELEIFLANRNLRVLFVTYFSNVEKCLASVSKLSHLRFLSLMVLDDDLILENRAIAALYHLQTLELRFSGIKKLPEDIGSLKSLRHLNLFGSRKLEGLPLSITNLMSLQTLDVSISGLKCLPEEIGALKHLRCLCVMWTKIQELPESITDCCSLEMLDLRECKLISSLPGNIGDLKHLRCLDVSGTKIKELPVSICDLDNLTWLGLKECRSLEKLPAAFGALNKLRSLDFSGSKISELPESGNNGFHSLETLVVTAGCVFSKEDKNWISLKHLTSGLGDIQEGKKPPLRLRARGIKRCTSLKTLPTYFVGQNRGNDDDDGNGIGDLGELNLLEGYLQIRDLQNVRGGVEEARRANLLLKQNIIHLNLNWCTRVIKVEEEVVNDEDALTDGIIEVEEVVVSDKDASSIDEITEVVEEAVGDRDPLIDGIIEVKEIVEEDEMLRDKEVLEGLQPHINLRRLVVEDYLGTKLPSWLMSLPYLVHIGLYGCSRCEQISELGLLPCLKKLTIWGLEKLVKWVEPSLAAGVHGTRFYHCLEELEILLCENLTVISSSMFPSLKVLFVQNINATGLCSLLRNNFTSLAIAKVCSIRGLKFLSVQMFQPSLKLLEITWCCDLQGFVSDEEKHSLDFSQMTSLQEVRIHYSEKWKPLEDLQRLPNLEKLDLSCLSWKDDSSSASSVVISQPAVAADGIQQLISLRYLIIEGWSNSSSLPHQLQYLTNLRGLWISMFDGLEALPEWLGNFSSLETLYTRECKNLMRLSSKESIQRLTSLETLYVTHCPLLEERCADKEGEEFQKISHIRTICGLGERRDKIRNFHEPPICRDKYKVLIH